jgi:phage repressor protein C with HTH and peptisase S24 domain
MSEKTKIHERLKIARRLAGYPTARIAAQQLGLPYPTIAGHENGSRGLARMADFYARAYGVSLDWLVNDVGEGPAASNAIHQDNLRDAIRQAAEAGQITYKMLSEAIGKNHAYVQQYVDRGIPRELRERDARVIADILETAPPEPIAPPRAKGFAPIITPGRDLVSNERSLPLYAAARGGDGHVIVTFEPIDYRKMPTILQGVKGGYGLLITGESMIPAYWPGDEALVNPNLPPQRDTDVILYHDPPQESGEAEAIVKRLVGINDREWTLEQYRPPSTFREARQEWPVCHRVVGKYNSR